MISSGKRVVEGKSGPLWASRFSLLLYNVGEAAWPLAASPIEFDSSPAFSDVSLNVDDAFGLRSRKHPQALKDGIGLLLKIHL
jgi:hypothetical protein